MYWSSQNNQLSTRYMFENHISGVKWKQGAFRFYAKLISNRYTVVPTKSESDDISSLQL